MNKNINLHDAWLAIFGQSIDDSYADQLINQNIITLGDLCSRFQTEILKTQQDREKFQIIKILHNLVLSDEDLIIIYQNIIDFGIQSIDDLKLIEDQEYENFGMDKEQWGIIQQKLNNVDQENFKLLQLLNQLVKNQNDVPIVLDKLSGQGINSVSSLFQLSEAQAEGIGINKFRFKKQQQTYNNSNKQQTITQSMIQDKAEEEKNNTQNQLKQAMTKKKNENNEIKNLIKNSNLIEKQNGYDIYQYPTYKRDQLNDVETYKSMIVVGQTGSGKTTLLNFFLNYYLEIEYTDNFRFILINEQQEAAQATQATSQTQLVNIKYIKPFNGKQGIRLIDTPGFGDTRGLAQDEIIGDQIRKCFKEDVESLSAICFLIQSSNARLTPNQNYILSCILQMFGKDVIKNFVFMLTFCDCGDPKAIDALRFQGDGYNQGCPVAMMIDKIEDPWYLKFNSQAFLAPNDDQITKYFWDMAITSFNDFYTKKLLRNSSQSLILTKEVIREREKLIVVIQDLRPKIEQQLHLIENFKRIHDQVQSLDNKIVDSKNYTIKSIKYVVQEEQLKQGTYTTNCIICNITCHYPCSYSDNDDKIKCSAMDKGYCKICQNGCIWTSHKNMHFRFISVKEEVETELVELKKQYLDCKSTKSQKQQILDGIEDQYIQKQIECMESQQQLMKSVNRLKEIAIQPACCEHQEQYVEIMIQEEMYNKKEGFIERINQLQEIKKNWKFTREAASDQGGIQITKEFIQKSISKEKVRKRLQKKRFVF